MKKWLIAVVAVVALTGTSVIAEEGGITQPGGSHGQTGTPVVGQPADPTGGHQMTQPGQKQFGFWDIWNACNLGTPDFLNQNIKEE